MCTGASIGGGRRALQHRGHRLSVRHPPGSGAQPRRYKCPTALGSTPPLSWTLTSLPTLSSNSVLGRKRARLTPRCLTHWLAAAWHDASVGGFVCLFFGDSIYPHPAITLTAESPRLVNRTSTPELGVTDLTRVLVLVLLWLDAAADLCHNQGLYFKNQLMCVSPRGHFSALKVNVYLD